MSESALKIDHMQRRVYGFARLNTNTMYLIIDCSCKIDCKMILIGNYTCTRSINEKSHVLVFGEIFIIPLVLRTRGIINISPNMRAIFH
jgi:hypothetical protein